MPRHYYWLKLNDDFFRDSSVKKLRQIAGGDTYTIIYLKLLLLSLPTDGRLYYDGIDDDFASQVALEIDEDVDNVSVTLRFLEARKILIQNTDTEFELTTEAEMVGSESESAKRMRKMRQHLAMLPNTNESNASHCDGYVTECDADVTRSDKSVTQSKSIEYRVKSKSLETRVNKKERDKERSTDGVGVEGAFSGDLLVAVQDWIDYKKSEKHQTYKPRGLNSLITQLKKAEADYGAEAVIDSIRNSMANGYQGIIFDKMKSTRGRSQLIPHEDDYDSMTDDERFPF